MNLKDYKKRKEANTVTISSEDIAMDDGEIQSKHTLTYDIFSENTGKKIITQDIIVEMENIERQIKNKERNVLRLQEDIASLNELKKDLLTK